MKKLVNNIHNKTIKAALSDPELAKRFFRQHLPEVISEQVQLESLRLQKGSFIDANLSEYLTDLLYLVDFQEGAGYVYLLLEHQSTPDNLMAFRLLKYMTNIMDYHLKKHKVKKLPFIYTARH